MNATLPELHGMKCSDLAVLLRQALSGEIHLPRRTQDELPAVSLDRLSREFEGMLQGNFETACSSLASEFAKSPTWSDSGYERQLLALLGMLRKRETSVPLEDLAVNFPEDLEMDGRVSVLFAIRDIRRRHDSSFWYKIGRSDPENYGGIAFSALLDHGHHSAAFILLISFPDLAESAAVAVSTLQLTFRKLGVEDQQKLLELADRYHHLFVASVRRAVKKWLERHGFERPVKKSMVEGRVNTDPVDPLPTRHGWAYAECMRSVEDQNAEHLFSIASMNARYARSLMGTWFDTWSHIGSDSGESVDSNSGVIRKEKDAGATSFGRVQAMWLEDLSPAGTDSCLGMSDDIGSRIKKIVLADAQRVWIKDANLSNCEIVSDKTHLSRKKSEPGLAIGVGFGADRMMADNVLRLHNFLESQERDEITMWDEIRCVLRDGPVFPSGLEMIVVHGNVDTPWHLLAGNEGEDKTTGGWDRETVPHYDEFHFREGSVIGGMLANLSRKFQQSE